MRCIPWLALAVVACGPTPHSAGGGDDKTSGDDQGAHDAPGPIIDAMIDGNCGAQEQQIGVVNLGDPPDLLVVLDRSGSMTAPPVTFPPVFDSKWDIMRNGLNTIAQAKDMSIRFGLMEFPSDDNCAADAVPEVPIQLGASGAISTYFAGRSPNGNTPAHIALGSALAYYQSIPVNMAGRYVLFATDGLPNCLGGDPNTTAYPETVAAVTALANAGIKTYVLGFGTFGLNTGVLDDAALAGGEAKPTSPHFYEASNASELDMALQAIAGGVIVPSCSFQLQSAPPDPNNVTVQLNGMVVPRSPSHGDGWDYYPDSMTITFFGSYCGQIMQGANTDVSFVYGCAGPIIE